jgi:23S rRNA (adenine2503-C2)-methyltransferase
MGEPLLNIEATRSAAFRLSDPAPDGLGLSARSITISTIGFPDRIREMAEWGRPFRLAVSWHAGTFAKRQELVPTAKHSFAELLAATDYYYEQTHREPTFEYVLLRGVNDSPDQAMALLRTLDGHRGKVQLIPFNPVPESGYERPDDAVCGAFYDILIAHGRKAATRKSLGRKIDAACGQLYRKHRVS